MSLPVDPQMIIMDFEQSEPAPVLLLIPVLILNHSKLEMFIRSVHISFCSERCAFTIAAATVSVVELFIIILLALTYKENMKIERRWPICLPELLLLTRVHRMPAPSPQSSSV